MKPAVWLLGAMLVVAGCGRDSSAAPVAPSAADAEPVAYTYQIVNVFPHDRGAFTEGLLYLKGVLFESTGLNGRSDLRQVDLASGRVLRQVRLSGQYFGEGLTILGKKIYQLTWKNQKGFVYGLDSFAQEGDFAYPGEGWGLTTDGHSLIMTDGSNEIRFLDPATFKVTRTLRVTRHGLPLTQLNELEWVKGELYANIWQTQTVARIDPATGRLLGLIDFSGLLTPDDYRSDGVDVLNGIAYDAASDRLFVTGKNWPKLFEVRVVKR
jgi:glutaminyl-peptide cyclotransferase